MVNIHGHGPCCCGKTFIGGARCVLAARDERPRHTSLKMSIGQPCKYCTHGKMRPIHFSWDQAVILCDNNRCKSILYASPSECIIKRDFLHRAHQPLSEFDLQNTLSDGSGGSSSDVYSGARSSLPSPAQSRKSGTDEEIELLLKELYPPLSKGHIANPPESSGSTSYTQISPKIHHARSDYSRYDGFFEMLGNLDLEPSTQSVVTESYSESASVETSLDIVTTELEEWMKDFEFPSVGTDSSSGISSVGCQPSPDETLRAGPSGGCQQLPDEAVRVESVVATTKLQGPCIPSNRSAFSLVDASSEESASFNNNEQNSLISSFSCHSTSAEKNETSGYLIQQCLSVPFVNELRENMSIFHTRFMSPTASAASEDSGYNEEDNKASSSSELAVGEENLKGSLKNLDDTTKGASVKQSHQSNFEKLMQNNLDWPAVSGTHTVTVLPAMVTTENNFTDSPQELLRLSSITQATSSGEICTTGLDERERTSFSTKQLGEGPQTPSEACEDHERGIVFSENYDNTLADESHAVSIPEPFDASAISQPSECLVSEVSSHSRFSEPENASENDGNSSLSLDTPSIAPLYSEEDKNEKEGRKRSKNQKVRSLGDLSLRKCVPSDNDCTIPDSSATNVRDGGCGGGKDRGRKVKRRRKSKVSGLKYSEKKKQNMPLKKGPLKKSCSREQPRRLKNVHKVLHHSARHHLSSWESQPPTSSGENLPAKNSAQELHESDDKRDFTATQNPGWQIPEGRTSHLSRRVTNLSPRKLLMGQVNRDPWSVADLYLEEVAIEVIVQDQQEVSRHTEKAAKYDVQLQELLSLFGKKQCESEMSHLSTSDTAQAFPSEAWDETSLEKENGEPPFKRRNTGDFDREGEKNYKNSHQDLSVNNEKDVQNYSHAKKLGQKEHVDTDRIEQKDDTTDTFHGLPTVQNSSQLDEPSESKDLTNMIPEDSQPLQKVGSDNENLSTHVNVNSGENEGNSFTVQINSNSFCSEDTGFIKQQLVSDRGEEGVYTSSLEGIDCEKIISSGQETPLSGKQFFDKPQTEAGCDSVKTGNSELKMERCGTERPKTLSSSIDQNFTEKLAFESISRQCIGDCGSRANIVKTSEYESPWFEKVCDKSLPIENEKILSELSLDKPIMNTSDQSDVEACSTSPEANPQYFLNPPKFGPVRSWIGHEDDISLIGNECCSKENIRESNAPSRSPNLKSGFSSSKYFQSLVEDMDIDEMFFQCPVLEHPSKNFVEHLKSSLFFGETASNSPSHIDVPKVAESDFTYVDCSESNSKSKSFFHVYDQHLAGSMTSAAYTQVPLVPLSSNIAQVPITSVPTNISSCEVSSIAEKNMFGRKALIIPSNSKVRCLLTFPSGINSFGHSVLSSSGAELSSKSLVLEGSAVGSSGEVNVGGKKSELTSASIKCASEWEIDSSKKSTKQELSCALELAGISSFGDGSNQENLSNSKHIKFDRNSKIISALPDSSQDIVDNESMLDVLLQSKSDSTSFTANFTKIPPSNTVSLVQTSLCHCSTGVKENCKTCNCNSGNFEDKTEITMHCKEQTKCKQDTSDSDVDTDKLPVISFESDDEIVITVPETVHEHSCTSQGEKESCVTSDENYTTERYLVDDAPVDQCSIGDESIKTAFSLNEIKEHEASLTKMVTLGLKRRTDDQDESNKKIKLLDTSSEVKVEEYIHKYENQSPSFSNSQCGALMCGILDNSVLHDEHCCSSLHQDFQDFPAVTVDKEETHQTVKTYSGSSKPFNIDKFTDNDVGDILRSCVAKESTDNDYSICSNAKEISTHTAPDRAVFSYDTKFGSMKASPQYDSYSCLKIEEEADDLNFSQLGSLYTGFLASLISPTESHVSMPELSQEQRDLEHSTLQESFANMEAREKGKAADVFHQEELLLNEGSKHNTSEFAFKTNNGDELEVEKNIVPSTISYIPSTDFISRNVGQFTTSYEEAKSLLRSRCRDNVIFTELGSNIYNKSSTSVDVLKSNEALSKTIVLRKSSQPSPSVSSQHSDASNKTLCFISSLPLPPVSSHALTKVNAGECYLGNQYVTGATVPHSLVMLPPFHSSKNVTLQPGTMVSSSFPHSGTTSSQMISSYVQKQTSQIDYQIPALGNPPTKIPPALVTSYANLLPTLAQSSPVVSSSTKRSMETIFTLSGNSRDSPVTTLVGVVASTPVSLNCMKANKSKLHEQKENNVESSLDYDNAQEGSSMLKKIKLGSKGSFYLRPTPALKNAISEMRKKENNEDKEEEETSSGYLTLPDGNPISHPIFIPSKKGEVQLIKHKRKRKKKTQKKIEDILEEKVKESLECSKKNEIPKLMVIYARRNFHICQIDVTEDR